MADWGLIAHGGARGLRPEQEEPCRAGMAEALAAGTRVLSNGGTCLDAVEAVVRQLEDDPTFNAGSGSVRNAVGSVQMDASIMEGRTLEIGAVIGLKEAKNPVSVARALLRDKAILLAGEGAEAFARQCHRRPCVARYQSSAGGCDTVGCVARDSRGNLAVATSTGGLEGSRVGRVGDVPLPGCGFYADNMRGAISLSGEGEAIARLMLAGEFLHGLRDLDPDTTARAAIGKLERVKGEAGLIAITPQGEVCWDHNSPHFSIAIASARVPAAKVYLRKSEEHERSGGPRYVNHHRWT